MNRQDDSERVCPRCGQQTITFHLLGDGWMKRCVHCGPVAWGLRHGPRPETVNHVPD